MKLSEEIIAKIQAEYDEWKDCQYGNDDLKARQKRGAFFTPPQLTVQMLEKFEDLNGDILDPTVGAGGLIAAAVIAGADPRKCYGIELDPSTALICRDRLAKLGVPRNHIKVGDALNDESYNFDDDDKNLIYFKIKDLKNHLLEITIEVDQNHKINNKTFKVDIYSNDDNIKINFERIFRVFSMVNFQSNMWLCSEKIEAQLKVMNWLFKKYLGKIFECEDHKKIDLNA